jgi:hypothetical protein
VLLTSLGSAGADARFRRQAQRVKTYGTTLVDNAGTDITGSERIWLRCPAAVF